MSADLCVDAERDLSDIGAGAIKVVNITKVGYEKNALEKALKQGVLFSTYAALTNSGKGGSRLDQIVKWLGEGAAEGCILFDESHKAKHLFPSSSEDDSGGGRGKRPAKKKSTKMAQACQGIQQSCPNARVVYCSATGASSLDNMAYMERLGLWGPGTPFTDGFGAFASAIGNGGVGAMELVALDMKRRGMCAAPHATTHTRHARSSKATIPRPVAPSPISPPRLPSRLPSRALRTVTPSAGTFPASSPSSRPRTTQRSST